MTRSLPQGQTGRLSANQLESLAIVGRAEEDGVELLFTPTRAYEDDEAGRAINTSTARSLDAHGLIRIDWSTWGTAAVLTEKGREVLADGGE